MGILLALDIGGKRTGMAISDETKTFAFPLQTTETHKLISEIDALHKARSIDAIVVGMPKNLKNEPTDNTPRVQKTISILKKKFPDLGIFTVDERFTSTMARQAMVAGGMKKKEREKRENTDKVSATLILQSFLEQQSRQ